MRPRPQRMYQTTPPLPRFRFPVTAAGTVDFANLTAAEREELNKSMADLLQRQRKERELVESLGMTWSEWRSLRAVFA